MTAAHKQHSDPVQSPRQLDDVPLVHTDRFFTQHFAPVHSMFVPVHHDELPSTHWVYSAFAQHIEPVHSRSTPVHHDELPVVHTP